MNEIDRSPSCPPMPTIRPVSTSSSAPKCGKLNDNSQGSASEKASAPSEPSIVLFGLISLRNGRLPNSLPQVKAATSFSSTANRRYSR